MKWSLRFPRRMVAALACGAAVIAGTVTTGPAAWARPAVAPSSSTKNWLYGVTAVSATDLWAVGTKNGDAALIENSAGRRWKAVTTPKTIGVHSSLRGVAAVSASDVWAVGYTYRPSTSVRKTLIEQYTGQSWKIIPSPDPNGAEYSFLYGVSAVSATDVWAVGYYQDSNEASPQTLIEQWNGSKWAIVPSPNPADDAGELDGVTAVSATDVWAVGPGPLTEQWNGTSWTVVSIPAPSEQSYLVSISGASASDVWAVGYYVNSAGTWESAVEQWNGTNWSVVANPDPSGATYTYLLGVDAVSASDIWAVGYYVNSSNTWSTLIEHSTGKKWKITTSPNPSGDDLAGLDGIASVSSSDVWAAGYAGPSLSSGTQDTLTEHSGGHKWAIVASANP